MKPEEIYSVVKRIPRGCVATYGAVARACGFPNYSRHVGRIMHVNPTPIVVPCHRVVFADGSLSRNFGFGAHGTQRELLEKEGITFRGDKASKYHFLKEF